MRASVVLLFALPVAACMDSTAPHEAAVAGSAPTAKLPPRGEVLPIGSLGGGATVPLDVNDDGTVVGVSATQLGGPPNAFRWTAAGGIEPLADLGGGESVAAAVNRRGYIAGASVAADGQTHLVLWDPDGNIADLGVAPAPFNTISAAGMNDRNEIAGTVCSESENCQAFRWSPGGRIEVLTSAHSVDESYGVGVSRAGDVAGTLHGGKAVFYGVFRWTDADQLIELGGAWDYNALASSVNAHGEIAGYDEQSPDEGRGDGAYWIAPFRWSEREGFRILGSLGGDYGVANDLNDRGAVVGFSTLVPGVFAGAGFYWSERTGMVDLGAEAGMERAYAVNNRGWVTGTTESGDAVVLTGFGRTPRRPGAAARTLARQIGGPGAFCADAKDELVRAALLRCLARVQ